MKVVTSLFKTISQPHLSKHRQKKLHRTIQPVIDLSFLKITWIIWCFYWRNMYHIIQNIYRKTTVYTNLRPGSSVVSADNMAATVSASDKHPYSLASIKVLEREGSSGSSSHSLRKIRKDKGNLNKYWSICQSIQRLQHIPTCCYTNY